MTSSDVTFVTEFHKLEPLHWCDIIGPQDKLVYLPWEKLKLPDLRSLCVISVLDDSELLFISRQTNLEVLQIGRCRDTTYPAIITMKGLHLLEELRNLRIFCIVIHGPRRMWLSFLLSASFVTKLEQLWVEFLPDYGEDEDSLKFIKQISPHLILRSDRDRLPNFNAASFIRFGG